jgi:ectoine hydroxylase-related dioxygenase (phytanoyl-CoA dioxygenase family)
VGVDRRIRVDGIREALDPAAFLDDDLPTLLAARADLLASSRHLVLRPLVVEVGGGTWTLRRRPGDAVPTVQRGEQSEEGEKRLLLRLTAQQLDDLVQDEVTPIGWMTAGVDVQPEGRIGHLLDWWLVLRSVLDERPVHEPGAVVVEADLGRSFTLDDDPADLQAFLEEAGYLHLRGVFSEEEMAAISADMDVAAPLCSPDDGQSWWATLADGSQRVVRMEAFENRSDAAAALLADDRFLALGALAGVGHVHRRRAENRIEALFKPIGVQQGISDVPWHKDCSLGRHSYECCAITAGISVTGAGPGTGQLRVAAGSHRALVWPSLQDVETELDLPVVDLATETGDVTLHLSCTLHMAEPPRTAERRVMYTTFGLPPADPEANREANRRLLAASRDQASRNISQVPAAP